ncbi:MAG: UvrB/UvrC motif-containing protein [bacterium]|nr:UvrB/UvrC motif-containing protein [bacterium]
MSIDKKCPVCGITLTELRVRHQAGCAECYSYFHNEIRTLINEIQSISQENDSPMPIIPMEEHPMSSPTQLNDLQKQLNKAVEQENYELAAKLRDLINELNQTVQPK